MGVCRQMEMQKELNDTMVIPLSCLMLENLVRRASSCSTLGTEGLILLVGALPLTSVGGGGEIPALCVGICHLPSPCLFHCSYIGVIPSCCLLRLPLASNQRFEH